MPTTIAAFREPWEAHMLCGRLRAEGVSAFIAHEMHVGNRWDWSILLGGVKVQVPFDQRGAALDVVGLCQSGKFHEQLADCIGDLDDLRCLACGSVRFMRRRPLLRAAFAIAASFAFATVLAPLGWRYTCCNCGTTFASRPPPHFGRKWVTILVVIATFVAAQYLVIRWINKTFPCPPEAMLCLGRDCTAFLFGALTSGRRSLVYAPSDGTTGVLPWRSRPLPRSA
jgi:hypothetical protein